MKKLFSLLFNPWTTALFCLLVVALVIYFIGPLVTIGDWTPWQTVFSRWVTIVFIVMLWLITKLVKILRTQASSKKLITGLLNREDSNDISAEEIATLKAKFDNALKSLKQSSKKLGRKFSLYELPWYIIIGPPGSGKTTALINSGLKFPLSGDERANAVAGVGGTRYCDWWFTDQAVLIDTAGRYTTQDSQKDLDKSAWLGFLQLLKRFRKRQPINGAFIAISISDLLLQNAHQRENHILSISQRLQELRDNLNIEFPVYVMLTKCDLIAGFDEFFDPFTQTDREQIWGLTLTLDQGRSSNIRESINQAFGDLIQRVNQQTLHRLHSERDQVRSLKITAFSKQLQQLQGVLVDFVGAIFDHNRYSHPILLRGVYLSSGTQEGTPIDRLMNKLDGNRSANITGKGKSFFLHNLFSNLVFAEKSLAGVDVKLEKRLRWLNASAIFIILGVTLGLLAGLGLSYVNNSQLIATAGQAIEHAEQQVEAVSPGELDPLTVLPILNELRQLPTGYQQQLNDEVPLGLRFGLYQGDKIGDQAVNAYRRVLNKALLPRLMLETEARMADSSSEDSYRYAALRIYLMLASDEHYAAEEVNTFFQYDWLGRNRRQLTAEQIQDFKQHFDVLFAERPVPLPMQLDDDLIKDVRFALRAIDPVQRVLGRMERLPFDQLAPFTLYDAAGKQMADRVFTRKSGASLTEGIDPLYTKPAYQTLMAGQLDNLVDEVISESWIFGSSDEQVGIDRDRLVRQVKERYLEKYADAYLALLQDIQIAPFNSYRDGAQVLNVLSSEDSPLLKLLIAVEKQTFLGIKTEKFMAAAEGTLRRAQDKLSRILGSDISSDIPEDIPLAKDPVSERFARLHALVETQGESQARPLQDVLRQFEELYRFMAKVAVEASGQSLDPQVAASGQTAVLETRLEADRQPDVLVRPLLNDAAQLVSGLAFGGVVSHINREWRRDAGDFCDNAIADRYPFNQNSRSEIALRDFGEFFGYGGTMDNFFKNHLQEFVDTSSSPWRIDPKHSSVIRISPDALKAFENAYFIRRAFFNRGSKKAEITFKLVPRELDVGLRGFYLDIDGQSVSYEFGPLIPTQVMWPGPNPGSGARLSMRQENGELLALREDGDWALFRLLDRSALRRGTSPERFDVTFKASGYEADYRLIATGIYNPFNARRSMNFLCPSRI